MHDKHELLTFINAFLTDRHHSEETLSSFTADVFRLAKDCLEAEPVAWTSQRSLDVKDKITAFTSEESAVTYGNKHAWKNIVPLYRR